MFSSHHCTYCFRDFQSKYSLELHIQSKHSLKECSKCHEVYRVDFYEHLRSEGHQKRPREEPVIATVEEVLEEGRDIHPAAAVDEDDTIDLEHHERTSARAGRPACARIDILGNSSRD